MSQDNKLKDLLAEVRLNLHVADLGLDLAERIDEALGSDYDQGEKKKTKPIEFENLGSVITIKGTDQCLGDLVYFPEYGVFDPTLGKVDIDPKYVDPHNTALDLAKLGGMDKLCEIGQSSYAYFRKDPPQVVTFIGTNIADHVIKTGKTITFHRAGKVYRGRLQKDSDVFNFTRIK
jgi:hypothetical protein